MICLNVFNIEEKNMRLKLRKVHIYERWLTRSRTILVVRRCDMTA